MIANRVVPAAPVALHDDHFVDVISALPSAHEMTKEMGLVAGTFEHERTATSDILAIARPDGDGLGRFTLPKAPAAALTIKATVDALTAKPAAHRRRRRR